jgi:chromosome segregation ATPase
MSPIGRVFIVLNLALAGGFAVLSGTYLQKQHSYKEQLTAEKESRAEDNKRSQEVIARLESDRNTFENAKTANETQLLEAKNQVARLADENKRLSALTSEQGADIKKLVSQGEAATAQAKAAFDQAREAYQMAIASQEQRDSAVRSKDVAEANARTLQATIASLEETIQNKEVEIAGLKKENGELGILVKAAEVNGFNPLSAAPNLSGQVINASGRLCTIAIEDNPAGIDIQEQINKRAFSFAIYDASGYKGEAIATKYEPSANAVLCNVRLVKDGVAIGAGDRAATKTN